ncbi:helix-turn-helix domain-containing protein [Asticcacaulis solisilvae]|uniref:helix-turn-helix domain-containing protein n=1 Tax=Asticcacaulis solisilvae TaxID=1217274 RepID=UPI003FD7B580
MVTAVRYIAVQQPVPSGGGDLVEVRLYAGLFAASILAFCGSRWLGGWTGDVLAIAGNATCGWSWLLVRALFHRSSRRGISWPLAVVLGMAASGAILRLYGHADGTVSRIVGNMEMLTSSTVLLLALVEPLRNLTSETPLGEKRFRVIFAGTYAVLLAVAVVWINGSPAGSLAARWATGIKVGCAFLALLCMIAAIWYRGHHPLPAVAARKRREPVAGEEHLASRVAGLMADDDVYAVASLKVADLAKRLGEPEYKVTQCITGALGFRNFNHMVNSFRIAEARRRLADPNLDDLPVLTIALDCGFGSIGPFNRAFKAELDMTPTAYRESCRADVPESVS